MLSAATTRNITNRCTETAKSKSKYLIDVNLDTSLWSLRRNLSFLTDRDKGLAAGQKLYFEPVDRSYKTVVLPPRVMG